MTNIDELEELADVREFVRSVAMSLPPSDFGSFRAISAMADAIAPLLTELRTLRKAREWQPIETAPRDGSEVLLFLGSPWSKVEKARWYKPWGNWQVGALPCEPAREEMSGIGSAVPTHWQPLPSPPAYGEEL